MPDLKTYLNFLHHAHLFALTVREVLEERYLRQVTPLDITIPQFKLLRLIAYHGRHRVGEMATFLGVSQAAASKNVDKLVRLNLVARRVEQDDRRTASLSLTLKGREVVDQYEALKEQKLQELLDDLDPQELERLAQGLAKVSYLILKKEGGDGGICIKCSAYYAEHCSLSSLSKACLYTRDLEEAHP